MLSRSLGIGIYSYGVITDIDLSLGCGVPFFSVGLPVRRDVLVNNNADLIVVRSIHGYSATIDYNPQAGSGREVLLKLIIKVVFVPEREVAVVPIDFVPQLIPVQLGGFGCRQTTNDQNDQQENSSGANSCRAPAFPLCIAVFKKLYDTPENDQCRPEMGKELAQAPPGHESNVTQQEYDSDHDENHGSCERAPPPVARRSWSRATH